MYHIQETENIHQAIGQYGVVCWHQPTFSPDDHIALANELGAIEVTKFFRSVPSHPNIALVEKTPSQNTAIGEFLHSDHTYDLAPAMGAILVARKLPPSGGDTIFVDLHAAYDQLSPSMQQRIEGLRAYHSCQHTFREQSILGRLLQKSPYINPAQTTTTLHPMVIQHPVTGRKSLFVNPVFTTGIEGLSSEESSSILKTLYLTAVQPQNLIRFTWKLGDVVIWDNRCVWHLAVNDYPGQHRVMHRISLNGCRLHDALGRFRSEHVENPPHDPLALRPGQTPFELPYVQLLHSATNACVQNVEGPPIQPWWPQQPSTVGTALLRVASTIGINVSKL